MSDSEDDIFETKSKKNKKNDFDDEDDTIDLDESDLPPPRQTTGRSKKPTKYNFSDSDSDY